MPDYGAMRLTDALKDAINNNDLANVRANLPQGTGADQIKLDECLILAIAESSLGVIELLLEHGAQLKSHSFFGAIARGDPSVFQLLIESGWDINLTAYEGTAVQ